MDVHRNTRRVLDAAAAVGLEFDVTRFPTGTRTAQDAADAIGCQVGAIVKSLVPRGTPDTVFPVTPDALVAATAATVADIAE